MTQQQETESQEQPAPVENQEQEQPDDNQNLQTNQEEIQQQQEQTESEQKEQEQPAPPPAPAAVTARLESIKLPENLPDISDEVLQTLFEALMEKKQPTTAEACAKLKVYAKNMPQMVLESTVMSALQDIMMDPDSTGFPLNALQVLSTLSLDQYGRTKLRTSRFIPIVLRTLQPQYCDETKQAALLVVNNMAADKLNKHVIRENGGLAIVLELAVASDEISEVLAGSLLNLIVNDEENKLMLAKSGALKKLIECLKSQRDSTVSWRIYILLLELCKTAALEGLVVQIATEMDCLPLLQPSNEIPINAK